MWLASAGTLQGALDLLSCSKQALGSFLGSISPKPWRTGEEAVWWGQR